MGKLRLPQAGPGWVVLGLALAGVFASIFLSPSAPAGPVEVTYRLQAESLARDFDRRYDERDRARFKAKDWADRDAQVRVYRDRDSVRYGGPLPYALALAPLVLVAPERGPYLLNFAILAVVALALAARLSRDDPRSAPLWSAALVLGTAASAYARVVWPELFVGALLVLAYRLTGDGVPQAEVPQMAPATDGAGRLARDWLGCGALLGLAVLHEPLYLLLLPAFLWVAPRSRADVTWAPAVGGVVVVLLGAWLLGGDLFAGVAPWAADTGLAVRAGDSLEDVATWTARAQTVAAPELVWDPRLMMWNLVYALVGRHVGIVLFFLPLGLAAVAGRWVRRPLWLAAAAILLLSLFLDPFNFFGGPEALGFRRALPLALVCFFGLRASIVAWPAVLAGGLGLALLSPLWLGLSSHPVDLAGRAVSPVVAKYLPFETSQRLVPASGEVLTRRLLVRSANDAIEPASGSTQLVLRAGLTGELMVASAGRLAGLDLEFGSGAGSELEIEGGVVNNLLFRPDGGVTFRLALNEPRIKHRVWGRADLHHIHMLRFSMPGGHDQPFSVSAVP